MDLASMLNDSQSRKVAPRLAAHTPHSSYDGHIEHTPGSDASSIRPTPYAPPLHTGESRAQGGGTGSYFAVQSPHPNTSASASTPSAGPHSAYAQSPGSYAGVYTPRDTLPASNAPTHNAAFVSPSPSIHHPPTPGSAHHPSYPPQQVYAHHQNSYPLSHPQFQSPPPPQANGLPPSHSRQISPTNQFQSQPATPLGPPIHYQKASPQAVRPPSQGSHDQRLRRESVSSISSIVSRDHNHHPQPLPTEHTRSNSIQRQYPYDLRECSRSESVSPKTIPKPPPQREHSTGSHTLSHGRPSLPPQPDPRAAESQQNSFNTQVEPTSIPGISSSNSMSSTHDRQPSIDQTSRQSPTPLPVVAPRSTPPIIKEEPSLKRSASHLSDAKPPPQKRPRGVIPRWAESARGNRPLRFLIDAPQHSQRPRQRIQQRPPPVSQTEPTPTPRQNGNVAPPQPVHGQALGQGWEPSIANIIPLEDLTTKICNWIATIVSHRPAPLGSAWEIEAKVGAVMDTTTGQRYSIPIASEALLDRELIHNTRFDSSMDIHQHKALNDYLNDMTQESVKARQQNPARHEIFYSHPKENDEFFELSGEGKAQLNPDLQVWINEAARRTHRREVRVRRSIDRMTGEVKAQIIKTRVADMDIYNPNFGFDYRVSISLETDWNGQVEHLTQLVESRGRNKDRLSYRHMMYQIDLTQVSHDGSPRLDHELEVEVSTEYLQLELDRLRRRDPGNNYEQMVRGLIDNVRLLCRQAGPRR